MSANPFDRTTSSALPKVSWWQDFMLLTKFRLSMMVVFTSIIGYLIASAGRSNLWELLLLAVGGFMITGASNALNQVLEKDYDALMSRTAGRPLPTGRMAISEGVFIAGIMAVGGLVILAAFNIPTALLGSIAFVSYAFIYTPLKRFTSLSVLVGAVPGALPAAIGYTAFNGELSAVAILLFSIQFIWQMPHFWSVGWLGYADYEKAGYKLLPLMELGLGRHIGWYSFVYTLILFPICGLAFALGYLPWGGLVALLLANGYYAYQAWQLYQHNDRQAAKSLLYASLIYLPVAFIIIMISSL